MKPAKRIVSAISLGVFCLEAPSTRAIILSKKLSPGCCVTSTSMRSERTFVPPVTELLSPPASRITGALSPVIALSSIEANPFMISPSAGMVSPASQINTSPFFRLSACALPRASAIASAKLANNSVINKITKTHALYTNEP